MIVPSALTLKFKIFQKVELINLCTERLIWMTLCKDVVNRHQHWFEIIRIEV